MKLPAGVAFLAVLILLITSCNERQDASDINTPAKSRAQTLDWDDLLPEGEDEILDQLYTEFYIDLDRRVKQADRQTLSEAARNGDLGVIAEGSALDEMPQIGTYNVVAELDGMHIRMPGYIVPLEYDAPEQLRAFLLVPYFGACIHTPPPPPNQIIFVQADNPIKLNDMWEAYWAEGILSTGKFENELGNAAYSMRLISLKPYD